MRGIHKVAQIHLRFPLSGFLGIAIWIFSNNYTVTLVAFLAHVNINLFLGGRSN